MASLVELAKATNNRREAATVAAAGAGAAAGAVGTPALLQPRAAREHYKQQVIGRAILTKPEGDPGDLPQDVWERKYARPARKYIGRVNTEMANRYRPTGRKRLIGAAAGGLVGIAGVKSVNRTRDRRDQRA